jgi:hypothetical protein
MTWAIVNCESLTIACIEERCPAAVVAGAALFSFPAILVETSTGDVFDQWRLRERLASGSRVVIALSTRYEATRYGKRKEVKFAEVGNAVTIIGR